MPQLRVTSPTLRGAAFELSGEYFTIGREPDNNIHLDHTSVSKHHAILKIDNGDFKLFDLHSTNGIVVNGERRVVAHLREGDKVLLGEIELCFEADRKEATQRLAAPMVTKPETEAPPAPVAAPAPPPAAPPKSPPSVVPAPATVAPVPQKASKLSALFRRRAKPEEDAAPAPSSREAIHAGLTETFGKMGLELPKPPLPAKPGPTELKPVALPPPPKTNTPKPKAQRTDELPPMPVEQPAGGTLRGLSVKLSWAMGRFLPERMPPLPPLPPLQTRPTIAEPLRQREELQVRPAVAVAELELKPTEPKPVTPLRLEPEKPVADRLLRTPLSSPAVVIEPPPAPPAESSRRRFAWTVMFFVGLALLGLGYILGLGILRFAGLVVALTGFLSLVFSLKYGSLIAPPKKRSSP